MRLSKLSKIDSELTDQDYDALKEKCKKIIKKSFYYGTKRFSYIRFFFDKKKLFKTTVFLFFFIKKKSQIKEFFNSLLDVRHEPDTPFRGKKSINNDK